MHMKLTRYIQEYFDDRLGLKASMHQSWSDRRFGTPTSI
jgi:hypothetical protein